MKNFFVTLPPNSGSEAKALTALRVLVVEDHVDTRHSLEMFLEMLGCEARLAGSLRSAREFAAKEGRFDLLLSDLNLPDGNGWDLLGQLKEAGQKPSCAIAMSGCGSEDDLARSKAAGFDAHLVKPFLPDELEAMIVAATKLR